MIYIGENAPLKCYFNNKEVQRIYYNGAQLWPTGYTITLDVEPEGYGTVTGAGTYAEGAQVTVSATSGADYRFVHWEEDDGGVVPQPPYTITINTHGFGTSLQNASVLTVAGENITDAVTTLTVDSSNVEVIFTLSRALSTPRAVSVNGSNIGTVSSSGASVSTTVSVQDVATIDISFASA